MHSALCCASSIPTGASNSSFWCNSTTSSPRASLTALRPELQCGSQLGVSPLLRARGFAFHDGTPSAAGSGHFRLECVRSGRDQSDRVASLRNDAVHFFFRGPRPGVALNVAERHLMLAEAVVSVVGINFVGGVVLHDPHAANIAHGGLHGRVGLDEKAARHPLAVLRRGESSARSSWADLHGALQLPIAGEVTHHLLLRTGRGLLLRGLSNHQASQEETSCQHCKDVFHTDALFRGDRGRVVAPIGGLRLRTSKRSSCSPPSKIVYHGEHGGHGVLVSIEFLRASVVDFHSPGGPQVHVTLRMTTGNSADG